MNQELWTNVIAHVNQFRGELWDGTEPIWLALASLLVLLTGVLFATLKSTSRRLGTVRTEHATAEEVHRDTEARLHMQVADLESTLGELRKQHTLLQGKYEASEHRRVESENRGAVLEQQHNSVETGLTALGQECANLASHLRTQSEVAEEIAASLQRQLAVLQARHDEAEAHDTNTEDESAVPETNEHRLSA